MHTYIPTIKEKAPEMPINCTEIMKVLIYYDYVMHTGIPCYT
jgi:hypothetical protein